MYVGNLCSMYVGSGCADEIRPLDCNGNKNMTGKTFHILASRATRRDAHAIKIELGSIEMCHEVSFRINSSSLVLLA